ncbi:MAG: hypothetical protein HY692_04555, partial [Cyanobacteria bacterium NC_groundwater_1444_Ag_S-0.65um_54_12]|nr:hypothetical protein [Cyanobacteria bacterium NC_groundwater_1444_Ag_S-0.65um_54_12]
HKLEDGWHITEDAGRGYRRVVPSPLPQAIVECDAIRALLAAGFIVVATGGGGIPVTRAADGTLKGVDAVIDKDFASALLATSLQAALFMISTAVERVALNFNKPDQQDLGELTLEEAETYLAQGQFAAGSMGPKIKAVIDFLRQGGQRAIITCPEAIATALHGKAGTSIRVRDASSSLSSLRTVPDDF